MEEFYTTRQIAKLLDLKTVTIRRWIQKGQLKAYKLGKGIRISKKDFENFLNERRIKI